MNNLPLSELPLIKRGSVKNLRGPLPGRNEIVFEFTDDFSVFDWGKMPDAIPGKGTALLGLAAHLFREIGHPTSWKRFFNTAAAADLASKVPPRLSPFFSKLCRELESIGMRTCFRGVYPGAAGEPVGLVVEHLEYGESRAGTLIPLEVVFRHALTDKSSFFERNPGTHLKAGHVFSTPLIEYFTKLEPIDRHLASDEETRTVGKISEETRLELEWRTLLLSLWLKGECESRDLELIDGKFEWGLDRDGRVLLADAIGPDELRLVERRPGSEPARLSKEFLREYYRESNWFKEVNDLKKTGDLPAGWQSSIRTPVPNLPGEALTRATSLYRGLERRFRPENVLLFGGGGREHAIARSLLDSPNLRSLIWASENEAGMSALRNRFPGKTITQWKDSFSTTQDETLLRRARDAGISLVIFSQDADLEAGAADLFRGAGFNVFGPSREAARIEWSKAYMKDLCAAANVTTAQAVTANSFEEAAEIIAGLDWSEKKYVVKADGLAAGKGVILPSSAVEARAALEALSFYGNQFIIEERLVGEESSWFAFVDGETFSMLDPAKDYKRLGDGQTGPNTGGMGAVSPAPGATALRRERVRNEIFAPIVEELKGRGVRYQGLLYAGLMIDGNGSDERIALLEFNARFGDPETQALLPRMESDLLEWMSAVAEGKLVDYPRDVPFTSDASVYVVAASEGYPERPRLGAKVPLTTALFSDDAYRFAGVRSEKETWITSGGRVLGAVGMASTPEAARSAAYGKLEFVLFQGAQIRKDIGR